MKWIGRPDAFGQYETEAMDDGVTREDGCEVDTAISAVAVLDGALVLLQAQDLVLSHRTRA